MAKNHTDHFMAVSHTSRRDLAQVGSQTVAGAGATLSAHSLTGLRVDAGCQPGP